MVKHSSVGFHKPINVIVRRQIDLKKNLKPKVSEVAQYKVLEGVHTPRMCPLIGSKMKHNPMDQKTCHSILADSGRTLVLMIFVVFDGILM